MANESVFPQLISISSMVPLMHCYVEIVLIRGKSLLNLQNEWLNIYVLMFSEGLLLPDGGNYSM